MQTSDVTYDLKKEEITIHRRKSEEWRVTLVDTGEYTLTGGRLLRVKDYLKNEPFCFTYGDGVGNIDIKKLVQHHISSKKLATLTAVQPPGNWSFRVIRRFCKIFPRETLRR